MLDRSNSAESRPRQSRTGRCSICRGKYEGWGNNARPVDNGRCCDECNILVVIPARLARFYQNQKHVAPRL
jgi:hypothetical protein